MSSQDLPLLSNIGDIRARHYLLQLHPNFHSKVMRGKVIIFFEPTTTCERRGGCCTRECACDESERPSAPTGILAGIRTHKRPLPLLDSDSDSDEEVQMPQDSLLEDGQNSKDKDFEVVLDCCDIRVRGVCEVTSEGVELERYLDPQHQRVCPSALSLWCSKRHTPLHYTVSPWCIKIWKPGIREAEGFPRVVCIDFETSPQGKSLLWRSDQDGNPCVFTPAAAINNRSLLPCQDPPSAMATWQAWVTVDREKIVSMTGDAKPLQCPPPGDSGTGGDPPTHKPLEECCCAPDQDVGLDRPSTVCFYYHTTMVLPIATIAIAIGKWEVESLPTVLPRAKPPDGSSERSCRHYQYPCHQHPDDWSYKTPLTLVYPPSCARAMRPIGCFLPHALAAATHLLGVYPCRRLEVVVLPQCFGSLGLASPNLIFLSPTVAIDDPSAFIRLAHEISHAWFGIVIGAQDWTEEWLSEGFATYMEDSIYSEAALAYHRARTTAVGNAKAVPHSSPKNNSQQDSEAEAGDDVGPSNEKGDGLAGDTNNSSTDTRPCEVKDNGASQEDDREPCYRCESKGPHCGCIVMESLALGASMPLRLSSGHALTRDSLEQLSDLRAHLRYRTLASEVEHSTDELQTLRPMQGEGLVGSDGVSYIKNGLNPEKTFLQVHYLKGYFLLKYLSQLVGRDRFDAMLKEYVSVYHGQLVLSSHILDYFLKTFPHLETEGITQETLLEEWLHQPGLNEEITDMFGDLSNDLFEQVGQHLKFWEHFDKSKKRSGQTIKRAKVQLEPFLFPDQLVLLLEHLLELPKVYKRTLRQINEYYGMWGQCGDVRHRWCELIIKSDYEDLQQVERFLLEDQAMGVYLYGELIISRNVKHRRLAEQVFSKIQEDMDETARMTVFSMLYGE